MVVSVEIFTDPDVLEAAQEQFARFPALAKAAFERQARSLRRRILEDVRSVDNYPGLPVLPFVWSLDPVKQARARRWYFANKVPRGSKSGRYERTGALAAAYDVTFEFDFQTGVVLELSNSAPGSEYVIGDRQVPSHTRSGWQQLDDVALRYSTIATDEFIDTWYLLSDPYAGVPE